MFETAFKALGEPTRLKILRMLAEQDLCVCDLEEVLEISQPRVSQHLKVLKQAGLVQERREAQKRICSFNKPAFTQLIADFNAYMEKPLDQLEGFKEIQTRLLHMKEKSCDTKSCKE